MNQQLLEVIVITLGVIDVYAFILIAIAFAVMHRSMSRVRMSMSRVGTETKVNARKS